MNKEELDYDYDSVIEYCKGTAVQSSFEQLAKDMNSLSNLLVKIQDSLHCGLETCPAFLQIYDGFSSVLGYYDGNNGGGAALLGAYAAGIFNVCYAEALQDKSVLEGIPLSDLIGKSGGANNSEAQNAAIADEVIRGKWGTGEERRRRLQEAGYDPSAVQKIVDQKMKGTYTGVTPEPTAAPETPAPAPTAETPAPEPPAPEPAPQVPSGISQSSTETAAALGVTPAELDVIKATIRHEAGNNPQAMYDVASCLRNRMTAGNFGGGSNPYKLITAPGQFASYYNGYYNQYTNGNYYQGDAATAQQVDEMLNAILLGTVPPTHNHHYFYGDGKQNHFYN